MGKSCSFSLLSVSFVNASFPFGFEGGLWDLIVLVPDHCLSFLLLLRHYGQFLAVVIEKIALHHVF